MNYSEYPEEIKALVKQKVQEQGNVYSEKVFDHCITEGRDNKGFDWTDTIEGSSFWNRVLIRKEFDTFYKKYPDKASTKNQGFTEIPIDVQEGDTFVIVGNTMMNGSTSIMISSDMIGRVVTLTWNDGTSCPRFSLDDDSWYFDWGYFAPHGKRSKPNNGYSSIPRDVKIGDQFIITNDLTFDGSVDPRLSNKIGEKLILWDNDGTKCPRFQFQDGSQKFVYWSSLVPLAPAVPVDVVEPVLEEIPKREDFPFNVGDEVEVVLLKDPNGRFNWEGQDIIKVGDRFIIKDLYNYDGTTVLYNSNKYGINWRYGMIKKVNKLNQYKDGKIISTSNLESPRILPAITFGSAEGRATRGCATNPVQLGC